MIRFCGFESERTVKEIREAFSDLNTCEKLIQVYRERKIAGKFDAVAAIILNGYQNDEEYQKNYIDSYLREFKENSTWKQNANKHTTGQKGSKNVSIFEELCKSIKEEYTLVQVYDELSKWGGWGNKNDVSLKNELLNYLDSDNNFVERKVLNMQKDFDIDLFLNNNDYYQVIFTGAPGTGKTFSIRKFVEENTEDISQIKFVQFHPSYDYSDFVEGLRPVNLEGSDTPTFVRLDGVFKKFCRTIVTNNLNESEEKNIILLLMKLIVRIYQKYLVN